MEHHTEPSEVTYHHEPASSTKRIWKTFWILLIVTVVEVSLGLLLYALEPNVAGWIVLFFKGMMIILTLAKAFYIVSIFMHLGDELRNMIMTIIVPLSLFIWFIGAFLWDGNYYRTKRNRYDPALETKTIQPPKEKSDTSSKPLY
ncbi:MAG: cytochrome C oxidase subunit IV family protein [Bacteroidota bacterium]|nr:cytochrome C oxidase subunit IV family protein [Bacteroidota bacterium]